MLALEAVVAEVCKEFVINKEAVIKKGMKRNNGYLSLQKHSGITCKELVLCISAICSVRQ